MFSWIATSYVTFVLHGAPAWTFTVSMTVGEALGLIAIPALVMGFGRAIRAKPNNTPVVIGLIVFLVIFAVWAGGAAVEFGWKPPWAEDSAAVN